MVQRIERKKWTSDKFGILSQGGLFDILDNEIKLIYRITDDEYDLACDILTDEEMNLFIKNEMNFAEKRKILTILNDKIYGFV